MRKLSATEERLQAIQEKIGKWNQFVRELPVIAEIAPALVTGRLELLKIADARVLTAEECGKMFDLVGGLLETNQALQEHASLCANIATEVERSIDGVRGAAGRLAAYANYRSPEESDSDEDDRS